MFPFFFLLFVMFLNSSQKDTIEFLKGMGYIVEDKSQTISPRHKLRRCGDVVFALIRMSRLARNWKEVSPKSCSLEY